MKPVSPVVPELPELEEIRIAEDQPEYGTLPAIDLMGGVILTRWELDEDEKKFVAEHGYIYFRQWTFGRNVQPVLLTAEKLELV